MNNPTPIASIKKFLASKDFDLARKRLLDLIYDTSDLNKIKEGIAWSKSYYSKDHLPIPDDAWEKRAHELLESLEGFSFKESKHKLLAEAKGVSKAYKAGKFALKKIDFSINSGEIVGIVGENGNGKTTFLRHLAGELNQDSGSIDYSYYPVEVNYFYSLKQHTGFIPQRIPKWFGKLRDNLEFTAAIHGIKGEENQITVDFILERFGLSKFQNLTWNQISSGYRTRFEVARIVLLRPKLLVLDEPLANLDINAQQTLLQDLRFIAKSQAHPMGVLLTSQQLYEVEKVADRVLFIQNGIGKYNSELKQKENEMLFVELETKADRELILKSLGNEAASIKFNGGVYQIEFKGSTDECLSKLVQNKVDIQYFRNITESTKRFFAN